MDEKRLVNVLAISNNFY